MTSSGVSKAVVRLESRIGVQLLVRMTRSVRLTPAGLAFHARCKAILSELADAEHCAASTAVVAQGKLVIAAPSTAIGRHRILPVLADFARLHPQVEIETRLGNRVVTWWKRESILRSVSAICQIPG